jgi:tRNA (cmo5U34)-methyltransferase
VQRIGYAREDENWFDDAFVADWLGRQKARTPERERQFAMVRALIPHRVDEPFRYINLGGGDGWLDEWILERFSAARAIIHDGSPAMLTQARARLESRFGGRVEYFEADLSTPAWIDKLSGPVDLAVSTIALHNLEDPARLRRMYWELGQLMSPGSMFMNLDYVRAPHPGLGEVYRFASSDEAAGFAAVRGYRDYLGTVEEHLGWLEEAGFSPADCFWRELRIALFGGFKGLPPIPESR